MAGRSLIGHQLGSYRIVSLLGTGAMGEVYRAHDARLGRDVALKILPAAFSQNEDRLRRFQQEARAAGRLNHPNIVAVHDVGIHEGSPYLVSELLEGETLQQRLAGRPLSPRKAVEYGSQIALGLAAAHENGIVHRDLKPANVLITRGGQVKILDFGLAKLASDEQPGDVAATVEATRVGIVLGTPAYMSPEQARGLPSDHRSDIFSLGLILYEMLSGRAPFRRNTSVETIGAIQHEDTPEFSEQLSVPPALERVVRHCLEKEPAARFQNARDLAFALEGATISTASDAKRSRRSSRRLVASLTAVGIVAVAGLAFLLWSRVRSVEAPQTLRVQRLTDFAGLEEFPSISPDGHSVAFTALAGGRRQIFVRLIAGGAPLQITRDAIDHLVPRWSADSSSIVYSTAALPGEKEGAIWQVSALGGAPRRLASSSGGGADVSLKDGRLAFFRLAEGRIQLVAAAVDLSGLQVVSDFPPVTYYLYPRWSPDGKWIAFQRGDSIRFDVFASPASGGEPRQLTHDNAMIDGLAWLPDSTGLIYSASRGGTMPYLPAMTLWQIGLRDGRIRQVTSGEASYVHPDIARNGTMVVGRVRLQADIWKFPVDASPEENVRRGTRVTHQTGQVLTPTVGRDDKEVAFLSDSGGHANLWVINTENGELRQITHERDASVAMGVPVWSPDGRSIAFVSSRGNPGLTFGVWLVSPDGSNLRNVANPGLGPAWSADGRWLYYSTRGSTSSDVVMKKMPAEGGTAVTVTKERLRNVIGVHGSAVYYTFERPLVDGRPEFEIRAADPEDGPYRVVARIPASRVPAWQIVNPALSPDGSRMAQALTDGFTTNIWTLSTSTGEWRQATEFGGRPTFIARRVSWSADGRSILAAVGDGDTDIVLLDGLVKGPTDTRDDGGSR